MFSWLRTLSSSIPNLQLDSVSANVHSADLEIDTNGRNETLGKSVVSESKKEGAFAHARIAN